ncbi:hypothetical protein V2J09_021384 [Rumex salicifolius]
MAGDNLQIQLKNYKNFVEYVCKDYKGDDIPEVCSSSQGVISYGIEEADAKNQICYIGASMNISSFASSEYTLKARNFFNTMLVKEQ